MALIHLTQVLFVATLMGTVRSWTPAINNIAPTVTLDRGVFVGVGDNVTHRYLGIPFAKPPYVPHVSADLLVN